MELIDVILEERPTFHRSETEISRKFDPGESFLPYQKAIHLASQQPGSACYGIDYDIAYFLKDSIEQSNRTLETGAGISTLIFAITGARHIAISPNQTEIEAIRKYAKTKKISLGSVRFIIEPSDQFLPNSKINNLDMVFIDGKHAFPWPIIDWFYLADCLNRDGIMIVDDAQMKSVRILVDFMRADPRWAILKSFGDKTFAFQKKCDLVHDVAWHMQPYNRSEQEEVSKHVKAKTIIRYIISILTLKK